MSQTVSRFSNPLDVARYPQLDVEEKRAIRASWASDRAAVPDHPWLRQPQELGEPVPIDDVFTVPRELGERTLRSM